MINEHVYQISELNKVVRQLLEREMGTVWLQGEVSNVHRAPSGHTYFTLKDDSSEIGAVRFKGSSTLTSTRLEPGKMVLIYGQITLYEPRGRYQVVAKIVQPAGEGALQLAYEQLKRKLQQEGLFKEDHKRPLPTYPKRIGIVTSATGAAVRDVLTTLSRRWPTAEVVIFPSSVQGRQAPKELVQAILRAQSFHKDNPISLLIITRGGGSLEDLASFNNENVARSIYDCSIPTVSAVGHEVDFTIADLVADARAPTPSAAAELVVPDKEELLSQLRATTSKLVERISTVLNERERGLITVVDSYVFRAPLRRLETAEQQLDLCLSTITQELRRSYGQRQRELKQLRGLLKLSDPHLPLRRGYSLTFPEGDSIPLRDPTTLSPGKKIETKLLNYIILSQVEEVKEDNERR